MTFAEFNESWQSPKVSWLPGMLHIQQYIYPEEVVKNENFITMRGLQGLWICRHYYSVWLMSIDIYPKVVIMCHFWILSLLTLLLNYQKNTYWWLSVLEWSVNWIRGLFNVNVNVYKVKLFHQFHHLYKLRKKKKSTFAVHNTLCQHQTDTE